MGKMNKNEVVPAMLKIAFCFAGWGMEVAKDSAAGVLLGGHLLIVVVGGGGTGSP